MKDWKQDKTWSDKFIPQIKRILAKKLVSVGSYEEDSQHNTDLIVLRTDNVRIGCRIRRFQYAEKYHDEFTIRCSRPNNTKTELQKIIEGWGNYFFYGFCNENESDLLCWFLGDLCAFRRWFVVQCTKRGSSPGTSRMNFDKSSKFRIFKLAEMPRDFVIDSCSLIQTSRD